MSLQTIELTLHIALATIPRKQEKAFPDQIKKGFYAQYVNDCTKYYREGSVGNYFKRKGKDNGEASTVDILYNPLKYYIFGNYDIAFISLSDSYKFAQRLFTPKIESHQNGTSANDDLLNPHSFQILTGIVTGENEEAKLRDFFHERLTKSPKTSTFIGICNLKLNNGLLAGNGYFFYEPVLNLIKETVTNILELNKPKRKHLTDDFLIMQSFSWFEISLILFTEDPQKISNVITSLRRLKVNELQGYDDIITRSVYFQKGNDRENEKSQRAKIEGSHIFADTHSYFGVEYDAFQHKDFMKRFENGKLELRSETEWQVKPGHLPNLTKIIESHLNELYGGKEQESFDLRNPFLITGKTDYFISSKDSAEFSNTHKLFQVFFDEKSENYNKIYDYVKKIKTNIQLKHTPPLVPESDTYSDKTPLTNSTYKVNAPSPQQIFRDRLKKLAKTPGEINELNAKLKALKISRQIRSKITKILYNYNNGILDSILFVYFIDFTQFIDELSSFIIKVHNDWYKKSFIENTTEGLDENRSVFEIENTLKKYIRCFEEAYELRMLNCYQYEDISDIDLDFNSSIQQLLTTYSTVASTFSGLFYSKKPVVPLVLLNDNKTEANYFSINYNVYHLLAPEFVFFTIIKEVLNDYKYVLAEPEERKVLENIERDLITALKSQSSIKDILENEQIDFDYLYIDAIRFYFTTNLDFKLFEYWFWMYNLQNAPMYEKIGIITEEHFKKELFRLMFLSRLYNFKIEAQDCPLPELQNYWDKYYYRLTEEFDELYKKDENDKFKDELFFKSATKMKANIIDVINLRNLQQCEILSENKSLPIDSLWEKAFENKVKIDHNQLNNHFDSLYNNNVQFPDSGQIRFGSSSRYVTRFKVMSYFHESNMNLLEQGQCIKYDKEIFANPGLYINALMYSYLKYLFDQNGGKVQLLKRNWKTGEPLQCFISVQDPDTYSVDQTGGTFFYCPKRLNQYFKTRNCILQSIWHFAETQKRELLDLIISNKDRPHVQI